MTLAVITRAFTGIGPELARIARPDGHQTVMVANKPAIHQAAADLGAEAVEADLATTEGIAAVLGQVADRDADLLMLNAGTGMGHAFLNQNPHRVIHAVRTNILGILRLAHPLGGLDVLDTPLGQMKKDDPVMVARAGHDAIMAGQTQMTPGPKNKAQATMAEILPAGLVAKTHRRMARPEGE